MGMLEAPYWSLVSVWTSSVARAYRRRPESGLDGAGEGGRAWPSRSTLVKTLLVACVAGLGLGADMVTDGRRQGDKGCGRLNANQRGARRRMDVEPERPRVSADSESRLGGGGVLEGDAGAKEAG